ncbi:UDP-N-acetylglucosamine--N-acetylmuramyl-(pentapeptide) pyrophosphoryl-undecaprenol N-acetylglucosamine transferase [candidate division KSB1 bacterium]|nr:UDP-N-acetylglucosamine--N-acetylmuramyl-(pentapeptide) pyrophosphoryl-undecaprenol N-acetylglucosamine transferase [candidate division KSB1 bacterium]
MKYILTGGGTGGHVYPALAIKEIIEKDDPKAEFNYIGVAGKAEEFIIGGLQNGDKFPIYYIHARGLPRSKNLAQWGRFFRDLWLGIRESLKIIKAVDPDLIISTGGYVSAPVTIAGRFAHKKIILQEQNSVPGLANRILCRFAEKILVTFSDTVSLFPSGKAVVTGYPLRKRIKPMTKEAARQKLGLPNEAKIVFVFGGSSGAQLINEAIVRNLDLALAVDKLTIIHGTGRDQTGGAMPYSETLKLIEKQFPSPPPENRYQVKDYFKDIDTMYSAADLVVSRAGAGTIMECASLGIPMILIPKSGLPGDHQVKNALSVEKAGGGVVVNEETYQNQSTLNGANLFRTIIELVKNSQQLLDMGNNIKKIYVENTNEQILSEIKSVIHFD